MSEPAHNAYIPPTCTGGRIEPFPGLFTGVPQNADDRAAEERGSDSSQTGLKSPRGKQRCARWEAWTEPDKRQHLRDRREIAGKLSRVLAALVGLSLEPDPVCHRSLWEVLRPGALKSLRKPLRYGAIEMCVHFRRCRFGLCGRDRPEMEQSLQDHLPHGLQIRVLIVGFHGRNARGDLCPGNSKKGSWQSAPARQELDLGVVVWHAERSITELRIDTGRGADDEAFVLLLLQEAANKGGYFQNGSRRVSVDPPKTNSHVLRKLADASSAAASVLSCMGPSGCPVPVLHIQVFLLKDNLTAQDLASLEEHEVAEPELRKEIRGFCGEGLTREPKVLKGRTKHNWKPGVDLKEFDLYLEDWVCAEAVRHHLHEVPYMAAPGKRAAIFCAEYKSPPAVR